MSDPSEAFLDGLEDVLRGSAALAAAMGLEQPRIYTERPAAAPGAATARMPYVQIGDDQIVGDESECSDPSDIFCTIHVYADTQGDVKGSRRARRIAGVLRALLKGGFPIEGHETVLPQFRDHRPLTDPSGATHVVMNFTYRTTPVVVESEA